MLTFDQRAQIFDKTVAKVTKEYFDPNFNGTKWPDIARDSRQAILAEDDAEAFERSMHELVRRLGTSHTGFFHQSVKRVPARLAIGATFHKAGTNGDTQWIVQDVHEGGPAHASGLKARRCHTHNRRRRSSIERTANVCNGNRREHGHRSRLTGTDRANCDSGTAIEKAANSITEAGYLVCSRRKHRIHQGSDTSRDARAGCRANH